MTGELLLFVVVVAVVAIAGIGLGMLVAPRLGRLAEQMDEEEGDGND
jgi:hypothetical protein